MTRYDTCDTQWLSRQPIMMVVQQLSLLQMVLRNSILASKVNWTQILHVNFPRCFHVFPSFFLKTFVPWCQLYVRRVLRAALAERATAPEVRKSKTWTKITGHMKKHEHIMTWHIVSQICWYICVNYFEPVRPSAALNATELARRWAIPSRPAAPSTVLSIQPCRGTWNEVGAQKAVYGKSQSSFTLAAGKTNLGHLEGREWFGNTANMKHHETCCRLGQKFTLLYFVHLCPLSNS